MIRIAQPMIGPEEEQAALEVLRSGRLVQGERVAAFEEAFAVYIGARHAVAVSSGTAALVVALQAHGIGPGDEVMVPAFTFAATANAVLHAGARPVLVDITADTFTIDPAAAGAAVTPRTKAIVPVHLYGHPAGMTALAEIAARRGLAVIDDACQSAGAAWQGRRIGGSGTACFSFYATKAITTAGEGGMVVTGDAAVAERARLLRNQGEAERYVTEALGHNLRLTELAAAVGLAQLPKLDPWNDTRRSNAAWLNERLAGVEKPVELPDAYHTYQQYTIRADAGRRDTFVEELRGLGVEAVVYYPKCVHEQPLYRELGIGGSFPAAERAARQVLSLPVHPGLAPRDLERIAAAVNRLAAPSEVTSG